MVAPSGVTDVEGVNNHDSGVVYTEEHLKRFGPHSLSEDSGIATVFPDEILPILAGETDTRYGNSGVDAKKENPHYLDIPEVPSGIYNLPGHDRNPFIPITVTKSEMDQPLMSRPTHFQHDGQIPIQLNPIIFPSVTRIMPKSEPEPLMEQNPFRFQFMQNPHSRGSGWGLFHGNRRKESNFDSRAHSLARFNYFYRRPVHWVAHQGMW